MNDLQIVQDLANILTPREIEILKAAAEGNSNKKTADIFRIAKSTVESHRHNIIKKLNVGNITEAVSRYVRAGVI